VVRDENDYFDDNNSNKAAPAQEMFYTSLLYVVDSFFLLPENVIL
jgi:hypothetical protein